MITKTERKLSGVYSSHGSFDVDSETGDVIKFYRESPEADDMTYIIRFNLKECREYWNEPKLNEFDILDLGFWDKDNNYIPPDDYFRDNVKIDKKEN